jgi:hypothetical protein
MHLIVVAGCLALTGVGATAAHAQFTDPQQPAADQYGTPTPQPTSEPAPPPSSGGEDEGQGPSRGGNAPQGGGRETSRPGGRDRDRDDEGGNAPAGARGDRESGAGVAGTGDDDSSLPFTGFNVATIFVLGLLLCAAGLGLAGVQRRRTQS